MCGSPALDFEHLFHLRLVVARYGEMDLAKWWNTSGQLGKLGASALGRGFPKTHFFAQARSAFAVAANRCRQVFDPPGCVTLWHLPEDIEDGFDSCWENWLDRANDWEPLFVSLQSIQLGDLAGTLKNMGLVSQSEIDQLSCFQRSMEARAIPLPSVFSGSQADLNLLALGFARSEPGALAVPYARLS